jgi:hypothetical protein
MTLYEIELLTQMADAYQILRTAYHHDMHREEPALTDLQRRVNSLLDIARGAAQ